MHFVIRRLFYEENRKMFFVPGKSSINREIREVEDRKKKVRLHCLLSFSSLYLRQWVDRNNLQKLEVARTLEKSAHPWSSGYGHELAVGGLQVRIPVALKSHRVEVLIHVKSNESQSSPVGMV
ncbi:hypothetical protein TNCV_3587351 [Trichonephila clavipes]|nr:hypothetical protein TNCV_3587351 [Trichonephila clavipes]